MPPVHGPEPVNWRIQDRRRTHDAFRGNHGKAPYLANAAYYVSLLIVAILTIGIGLLSKRVTEAKDQELAQVPGGVRSQDRRRQDQRSRSRGPCGGRESRRQTGTT